MATSHTRPESSNYLLNHNKHMAHADNHDFTCVDRIASCHSEHSRIIPEGYKHCSYCLNGRV